MGSSNGFEGGDGGRRNAFRRITIRSSRPPLWVGGALLPSMLGECIAAAKIRFLAVY